VSDDWVFQQFGGFLSNFGLVKFTFPLNLDIAPCARYLFDSGHCAFVLLSQSTFSQRGNIPILSTGATVVEATEKLLHGSGFDTGTVCAEEWQFWQYVFANVSRVKYTATVCLFHVQEPHQCILPVILIADVTARGYQAYRGRLQKVLSQHLIASASDRVCLEEILDFPDLYEIAVEYLTRLTQTVTSS
jgi:hypothetical protein